MVKHSADVAEVVETLKDEGIEENTLLVWMSDNGPTYAFFPNSGYSWLRGGKGDVLEGGVRTPAFARWPGMHPGARPGSAGHDPCNRHVHDGGAHWWCAGSDSR